MPRDQYEPNRVMGIPWTRDPQGRWDYEPKRVMGFPVDWSGEVDLDWVRSLAHPVRGYRRWLRRRRLGPYALDEDDLSRPHACTQDRPFRVDGPSCQ